MINKLGILTLLSVLSSQHVLAKTKKTKINKIPKGFDKQDDLKLDNQMYDVLTAYRNGALPTSLAEMLMRFYDPKASASSETLVCVQALVVSGLDLAKPETFSAYLDENTLLKLLLKLESL